MAHWQPKAPSEVVERRWAVPVPYGDTVETLAVSAADATADTNAIEDGEAVVTLSGGTDGTTATVTITAATSGGLTLVETFYLPIRATANAFAYTVRDVCEFALRKVVGAGSTPEATELDDAKERLSDMLAAWAGQGADLGVKLPCEASDVLYLSDAHVSAVKNNLIVQVADLYEIQLTPFVIENARRGLQQVKTALLSQERGAATFY